MKKIGFLFIDKSYAIYHAITVAITLAKSSDAAVSILCTKRNHPIIIQILQEYNCTNIKMVVMRPYWFFTLPHFLEIKLQLRRILFYKYRSLLYSFDALVCTVYNDLILKKRSNNTPKLIYTQHGISHTDYAFDSIVTAFDLFFVAGKRGERIRKNKKQLNSKNYAIVGYPKYDLVKDRPDKKFFDNDKPIVLYNPHWQPTQGSFFKFGEQVLDFFAANPSYNFIFAPHSLLLVRNKRLWFKLLKYKKYSHLLIDWGSEASNDMSYTKAADFYLGDVSSQALEFVLIKERPCLFLDAHQFIEKKEQFISWQLGSIISDFDHFETSLKEAFTSHAGTYQKIQKEVIDQMIFQSEQSASQIAAAAILGLLKDNHI